MDKREAIDALAKLSYDRILVEDEYIVQDDGTPPVRNQMFSIAEAFKVKVPIETFQPNPNEPKGPLPNHSDECLSKKDWSHFNVSHDLNLSGIKHFNFASGALGIVTLVST